MKSYPQYKESGSELIKQIPVHWKVAPLKFIGKIILGKMLTPEDKGGYTEKPYLRAKNIGWETVDAEDIKTMWFSPYELKQYRLEQNDLLISEGGEVGRTAIWNSELDECYIQNSVHKVTIRQEHNPRYYLYHSQVFGKTGYYDSIVNRVSIAHLTGEKLKDIRFVVPPCAEQQAIADFLDCKTAQIDTLIEKKQRQIDLLQEQRIALINQAVTKGLSPNAPMKDSGVEWLGEIPSHWSLPQIRHVSKVVRGQTPRPAGDPRFFNGSFIPWITVGELTKAPGMYVTNTKTMLTEEGSKSSIIFEKETFVLTNSGATLGVPKILGITGCMNDGVAAFMNIRNDMSKKFMYFFFLTMTEILKEQAQISGQPNLNTTVISEVRIPKPNLDEQEEIVSFLIEQEAKFDSAVKKCLETIELLQEYRTALISEAVTGKIDVR